MTARTMAVLADHTAHSGHGTYRAGRMLLRAHPRNGRTKEERLWLAIVQGHACFGGSKFHAGQGSH